MSLALVESNTGGELAQRFSSLPAEQNVLVWNRVIQSAADLAQDGPDEIVSEAGARWVAEQARLAAPGDDVVTLAVCGTSDSAAGPYGAYRGETFVAVALGDALTVKRIDVGGVDELARRWSGNGALNELRLRLTVDQRFHMSDLNELSMNQRFLRPFSLLMIVLVVATGCVAAPAAGPQVIVTRVPLALEQAAAARG